MSTTTAIVATDRSKIAAGASSSDHRASLRGPVRKFTWPPEQAGGPVAAKVDDKTRSKLAELVSPEGAPSPVSAAEAARLAYVKRRASLPASPTSKPFSPATKAVLMQAAAKGPEVAAQIPDGKKA